MAKTPHILLNKARNIEDLCQSASGIPDLVPVLITVYVPDYRNDTDFLCLFHPYALTSFLHNKCENFLLIHHAINFNFSFTFDKVQSKADSLWRYNYYAVVYEHYDRPRFIIIEALIRLTVNFVNNCIGNKYSEFR